MLSSLAISTGEELYSGVAADLMGRDFTIFRSLGQRPSLRTEPHDSRWLNGERLGVGTVGRGPSSPTEQVLSKAPAFQMPILGQALHWALGQRARPDRCDPGPL